MIIERQLVNRIVIMWDCHIVIPGFRVCFITSKTVITPRVQRNTTSSDTLRLILKFSLAILSEELPEEIMNFFGLMVSFMVSDPGKRLGSGLIFYFINNLNRRYPGNPETRAQGDMYIKAGLPHFHSAAH